MRRIRSPWADAALLLSLAALLAAGGAGCTDPQDGADGGDGDADVAGGEVTQDVEPELQEGQICLPGSVKACVVEGGKEGLICNASGTAFIQGTCKGPDGRDSQCVNSACTECFPGTFKCETEDLVVRCADDGSAWEPWLQCNGRASGQVCTGQTCESLCSINIKFNSYIGCDYWGIDLDNAFVPGGRSGFYDAANSQYAVVVAVPPDAPLPATVEVRYKEGGFEQKVPCMMPEGVPPTQATCSEPMPTEPLEPGELRVFRLPPRNVNGTVLGPLAYRITSSVPVIAYQFNPLENSGVFSNDASLLLPSTLLGREYFVMTREQTFDTLRGFLTVAAVLEGETTVSVQVTGSTQVGLAYEGAPDEAPIAHMEAGDTRIFKLKQYDVLNIETDRPGEDLTGSRIVSDKRIVVFGGSEAANAPNTARCVNINPVSGVGVCEYDGETSCQTLTDCVSAGFNTCCADHLEHQLPPVKTWGTRYVATKSWDRGGESDIWRILASEDNTKIIFVPPLSGPGGQIVAPILNRGEWFEFESRKHFEIHSVDDKPILVGQFLAAQDAPEPNVAGIAQPDDAGTGDPAFMIGIPVEQYRTDFAIFVPAEYEDNYVNITAPTGSEVTLDGEAIPPGSFELIGSGAYSVYRTRVAQPGPHTVTSSEPASVIVYGYDQYVSYAYPGGLDLAEINQETAFGDGGTTTP